MLENKVYSISELRKAVIKESSNEFKPVLGKDVEKDNASNNDKAVKDIAKETKDFNNVSVSQHKTDPKDSQSYNKTTLDVNFMVKPGKEFDERVKAQVLGYPSVENQKNTDTKENKSLDYSGNEKFYEADKEKWEEMNKQDEDEKNSGLKSNNKKQQEKNETLFQENKTMKRLQYNKAFLNEEHMIKKIPDDYKVDGNRFMMRDINGAEYIVECKADNVIKNYIHTFIVSYSDTNKLNEQLSRMKTISGYNPNQYYSQSTSTSRMDEDKAFSNNLNKMRVLGEDIKK